MDRRTFIQTTGGAAIATSALAPIAGASEGNVKGKFDISVAAWSWHKMFFNKEIVMTDQIDLVKKAGATGLELVNSFFPSPQYGYLNDFNKKAKDAGVNVLLIMVDNEGSMNDPNFRERHQTVVNHRKWLDIAAVMGCHSIRVNAGYAKVDPAEGMKLAADALNELCQYARQYGINVIIENHGGPSSDPKWLVDLMKLVDVDNFGILPDFGNFPAEVDKYAAVEAFMPYAKAVSAKCYDFGPDGNETKIDFHKMMKIVLDAGYHGYVGVEYEGGRMSELDGVAAAVKLLKSMQA